VPHVAAPQPFRALGLGRVAGGTALLHHRRAARPALALHLQAAMTIDARHPLPGSRPLVVGAARSGLAAARLLAGHGLAVRVCDRRPAAELGAAATALAACGGEAVFGRDAPSLLDGRDVVVWSPGIPVDHPIARAARARSIPVLSELEIGFIAAQAPFLCVTGTNGKSTTTDLVGALLKAAG